MHTLSLSLSLTHFLNLPLARPQRMSRTRKIPPGHFSIENKHDVSQTGERNELAQSATDNFFGFKNQLIILKIHYTIRAL